MRFSVNIFRHIPWRVFSLSLAAAVALAAVIACGDAASPTATTPTQPSGVGQPTGTEGPSAVAEPQGATPAGAPTQEAQQEPPADDDQQAETPAADPTPKAQQEPPADDDQQAETPTAIPTQEAQQEPPADDDQQAETPTATPTQQVQQEPPADDQQTEAPTATPTQEAQQEPPSDDDQQTQAPTATPTQEVQQESQADDDQQAQTPTAAPTQAPQPEPTPEPTPDLRQDRGEVGTLAPEFRGISNWINSPPLSMQELRGQVVLIDFWTYTCVNCIRTLPYLKEWHAKYAGKGLTIVGVHTPEFEFEKVTENVVRSAEEYGLGWPIAQDNDFKTWRDYANRYWPAKYLVDQHGAIRYRHFGEGRYLQTEEWIRDLLEEAGVDLSDVEIGANERPARDDRSRVSDPATKQTREIYGGYHRNSSSRGRYIAHPEYYDGQDRTLPYVDPGDHQNQFMYLQGLWTNGLESLRHARETENYEDYIALKFAATTVNAVVNPEGADPFDVRVTIDGHPLSEKEAGPDVVVADGHSFFTVTEPRMYEVVALHEYGIRELTLSSNSDDFALFAFTFGSYERGP